MESETMEEIKVGHFVRERGEILKIEILKKDYEGGVLIKFKEYAGSNVFKLKEIEKWKHSPNIIDVIEVGDYVNGYKVSFKDNDYRPFVQCDYPVEAGTTNHYRFYEEAIYSIVTHESFNSIKYEVI
jgi:hypothetical protein